MATEAERAAKRAWNIAHPEQVRAHKKAYYIRHRARLMAKQIAWYEWNREAISQRRSEKYAAERKTILEAKRARYATDLKHAARVRADNRKYRADRLEEFRERDRVYAKVHQQKDVGRFRAKMRRANHRRRALEIGAFVEDVDHRTVFERDRGVCGICRERVDPEGKWHVDHVIPLSKGGEHSYANVQLAHARCNLSKGGSMYVFGGGR